MAQWISTLSVILMLSPALVSTAWSADRMPWRNDIALAQAAAASSGKLVLVHFYADWCGPCRRLENNVYAVKAVGQELTQCFELVKINIDEHPDLPQQFAVNRWPTDLVLNAAGETIAKQPCPQVPEIYVAGLMKWAQSYAPCMQSDYVAEQVNRAPAPGTASTTDRGTTDAFVVNQQGQQPMLGSKIMLPKNAPPLALAGYDIVNLLSGERAWVAGDSRYGAIHQGRTYLFVSAENQQMFLKYAGKLAPVANGHDAVLAIDFERQAEGQVDFAAIYGGRLYLFANQRSLDRFNAAPDQYTEPALMAVARQRAGQVLKR